MNLIVSSFGIDALKETRELCADKQLELGTSECTAHYNEFLRSLGDHQNVTIKLQGIPKILAMYLNSIPNASLIELSNLDTSSEHTTELERKLYLKWCGIFSEEISKIYPALEEKLQRLVYENASYLLDVFTPISVEYTTTLKNYCLLYELLGRLGSRCACLGKAFRTRLADYAIELSNLFFETFCIPELFENRYSELDFITNLTMHSREELWGQHSMRDAYTTSYEMSFSGVAYLQRHHAETIKIIFDRAEQNKVYVPPILEGELVTEWVSDYNLLVSAGYTPCGSLVKVIEMGTIDNFLTKCPECLCANAPLEVCKNTIDTLERFADAEELSKTMQLSVFDIVSARKTKCDLTLTTCSKCFCEKNLAYNRLV